MSLPPRLILLLSLGINLDNDPHDLVVAVDLHEPGVAGDPEILLLILLFLVLLLLCLTLSA